MSHKFKQVRIFLFGVILWNFAAASSPTSDDIEKIKTDYSGDALAELALKFSSQQAKIIAKTGHVLKDQVSECIGLRGFVTNKF